MGIDRQFRRNAAHALADHAKSLPHVDLDDALRPGVCHAVYTPREAARHLDIGLTSLYALLKRGELNAVKLGSLTKISAESIEAFIAALPARAR